MANLFDVVISQAKPADKIIKVVADNAEQATQKAQTKLAEGETIVQANDLGEVTI